MNTEVKNALEMIVALSSGEPEPRDFEEVPVVEAAGGNFDDAYDMGFRDGAERAAYQAAQIAREALRSCS